MKPSSPQPAVETDSVVTLCGHHLDLARRRLQRSDGSAVDVRPQALDLLCVLARQAGEVVGKKELFERIWPGMVVTDDSLVQAVGDARRAIGDDAHVVIQTVPRRGYRMIVEPAARSTAANAAATTATDRAPDASPATASTEPSVFAAPAAPTPVDAPTAALAGAAVSAGTSPGPARPWRWAGLGVVAITAVAALGWWLSERGNRLASGGSPDRPPIAVLDFADPTSAPAEQWLGKGFTEELVGELARNADLRVIAASSSLAATQPGAGPAAIAARLGAGYLVSGNLRREGENLRLVAHLVDGRDGRVVWTERRDLPGTEMPAVREALITRVAATLQSSMRGHQEARGLQRPANSLDVYEMTLRGLALKHRIGPKTSAEARLLLQQAVESDPSYAPAWAYLGMVDGIDYANAFSGPRRPEMLARAIANLERAIELDPRLSSPHLGLSFTLPFAGRHVDAVRAGRRCMEISPSDAECMVFLAEALRLAGEPAEALALVERALPLNPLPPSYIYSYHANILWAAGRIDESILAYGRCLEQAPQNIGCRRSRTLALAEAGRMDQALAEVAMARVGLPPGMTIGAMGVANLGPGAKAQRERRLAADRRLTDAVSATAPAVSAPPATR